MRLGCAYLCAAVVGAIAILAIAAAGFLVAAHTLEFKPHKIVVQCEGCH